MAEFGIMGVLTELAHNVGISIPAAGHMISYYALGWWSVRQSSRFFQSLLTQTYLVVSGGVVRHWQRHVHALFVLPDARHWSAGFRLPAWCIFGVGAIVLSKIIKPGKVTAAVAGMVSGMTVANLLGIPLGTYLSQEFSWRYTFLLIAIFNIAVMASVYFWVPDIRDEAKGKLREQFHFYAALPRG